MDRNAILATVLVILILVGYQGYLTWSAAPVSGAPPLAVSPGASRAVTAPPASAAAGPAADGPAPRVAPTPPQTPRDVIVETPLMHVVFTTAGARVTSWQLKKYRRTSGAPVDLAAATDDAGLGALSAWADADGLGGPYEADVTRLDLTTGKEQGSVTFRLVDASGIALEKRLTFYADRYLVDVAVSTRNVAGEPKRVQTRLAWGPGLWDGREAGMPPLQPPTFLLDGRLRQENVATLTGERAIPGTVSWAALEDAYFAAALVPREPDLGAFVEKQAGRDPLVGVVAPPRTLAPGQQTVLRAALFAGPRDIDVLKTAGQHLDRMVDLGWFSFLARPALWLLERLDRVTGSYGLAIILVTLLVRLALYPLTARSLKSMRAMQTLQPQLKAIQERYKNNAQKKQEEMMALYRRQGVNPMGGCLPMLVQIPIFIALYRALSSSVAMWQAPFLWVRDLTRPDALFTTTVYGGHAFSVNLLALLMGASMWLQQKMSPAAGDAQQAAVMLWTMPLLFTFMFWSFPARLVLYWLVSNLLQTGQQWLLTRTTREARPAPA